jgi:ribosomal protein S18 acetylase RimI-like enzyme
MLPFAPSISVRPFAPTEWETAGAAINRLLLRAPYSAALDAAALQEQLFGESPPTVWPVRWQRRQVLGAWRAGDLVGVLDAATGLDSASLQEPDYQHPLGLLRFLVLPERPELINEAAAALFAAAIVFWRSCGVGFVKAYHLSTGYPSLQAGAGLLPGDWSDQVRLLTEHGFRFVDRYYLLRRALGPLIEETVPQGGLSLAFRGGVADRRYQVFYRRTELIAEARLLQPARQLASDQQPFAYIAQWSVDERWRNQKIGRWLLRRMINDATQQGVGELAVHLQLQQAAAMNLLAQHGFVELNYRGYSFEKELAE